MSKRIDLQLEDSDSHYVSERKVYPRDVSGRYDRLRKAAVFWLLGMYYLFPWLKWDGRQAVLFDLPARKFHVFGLTFWPQDFSLLAILLIVLALTLFFVTALAGRLWCGYACPQTVWTETFLWMERWTEGDRQKRMKLDAGPRPRTVKSVLERARGLLDVHAAYDFVFRATRHPSAAAARLQAASTIALAGAGEDAVPLPKFAPEELGDCIDCTMCVQVCPVGIDIRNGLQYECIACGACIDACDEVMDKVGYPHGLIRYSTQNAIDGKPTRVLRPRIFVYATLLAVLVSGWAWGVAHRSPLIADILRDRNALYREAATGIENGYTLKLANKTDRVQHYLVALEAAPGLRLRDPGPIEVAAGDVASVPLTVVGGTDARGRRAIRFDVHAQDGSVHKQVDSSFFGPL